MIKNVIDEFFCENAQDMITNAKKEDARLSLEVETPAYSICLDVVLVHGGIRSVTKLVCGH